MFSFLPASFFSPIYLHMQLLLTTLFTFFLFAHVLLLKNRLPLFRSVNPLCTHSYLHMSISYNGFESHLHLHGAYLAGPLSVSTPINTVGYLLLPLAHFYDHRLASPLSLSAFPSRASSLGGVTNFVASSLGHLTPSRRSREFSKFSRNGSDEAVETRRDTRGGSLVCFHCLISVHNKHIISRWTTLLPSHLGWELDWNKQPSLLYRSSSNGSLMGNPPWRFRSGRLLCWWVNRRTGEQEITTVFYCCVMLAHAWSDLMLSPTLRFGQCSCDYTLIEEWYCEFNFYSKAVTSGAHEEQMAHFLTNLDMWCW